MKPKFVIMVMVSLLVLFVFAPEGQGEPQSAAKTEEVLTWNQVILRARRELSRDEFRAYVAKEVIPGVMKFLNLVLGDYVPTFTPSRYAVQGELGWIITYRLRSEELGAGWVEQHDPDITVYLPAEKAEYLDVVLAGRGGWIHRLKKSPPITDAKAAKEFAEEYLHGLNIKSERFQGAVSEGSKFRYNPKMEPESTSLRYAALLPEAFEVFFQVDPSNMVIRREFMTRTRSIP